jgi:hypothetical protein
MVDADPDMVTINGNESTVEVAASHSLLGRLSGRAGAKITTTFYGGYGTLLPGPTVLLGVHDMAPVRHLTKKTPVERHDDWVLAPMSIFALDQGRVVSCNFAVARLPRELDLATDGKFTVNALKWAAKRPVN